MAYFDNAATTYPKPECVYQYMDKFYRECGGNAGRGNYEQAKSAGELIANTRSMIQDLLHCPTKQVVFEPTATIALNLIIQGNIERGAHNIYVSPFEHNAVTRVLHHFEKQENSHMISNLQNIVRCVSGTNRDLTWLNSISANVLKMTNFSDKDLLLMNKVNEDRYPKPVLRNFMCQYLLSGTYMDMFDETKKISVFCEDADTLEAHHIIPLGSAKKVGEITADIRKNPRHICNSPLNFVYITKAANKDISDDALDAYEKKIQPAAKAALFISSYTPASHDTEIKVRGLLESRYSMMQGTISGEINDLLTNWM